jgi:hypothetical protein
MSDKKKSLREDEIVTERNMGRRSLLGIVGGGLLLGTAATVVGNEAKAQKPEELASDSDSGANADPAGRGRTGHTDRDSGGSSDQAGRGVCAERGHTDSDTGGSADAAGRGRGPCR